MTSIDDILAKLDKDTLTKVKRARDVHYKRFATASFGVNQVLGGGLVAGKQHTIWGNEGSTKSAFMMETVALNQRNGVPCAWVDAEHSFDPAWAERLGVDVDNLILSQEANISAIADRQVELIRAGVEMIVIDTTSSLMPKSFFSDGEMKDFDKAGQIGQFAKDLGQMCKMVQGINWTCAVVHISQVRMDLGNSFMPGMKQSGGKETEHNDQFRLRLFSTKSEKQAIMGELPMGDSLIQERIGRKVKWSVDKNKINGKHGEGEYGFYNRGDFIGLDRASELVTYGIKTGAITKGGAWYTIYGERFQGENNAIKYVRENREVADTLEAEILAKSI